jgi:acyl carrier protein
VSEADVTLRQCFGAAFPGLPEEMVAGASVDTLDEWDSLHALVLMALVEEAFGIRIASRDYPRLRSYAALREYVARTG